MVCIYCGNNTTVSNSRHQKRNNAVWRRRVCTACEAVFTTLERAEFGSAIMITDKDGLRPLERDQLLITIYESCKHRTSAFSDAVALTNTIVGEILKHVTADGTIEHKKLHSVVRTVLERFDPAAATIYTAYSK